MASVEIYTIKSCWYCANAKQLLERNGITYEEHDLSALPDAELNRRMIELSGQRTVPQIVINGKPIGGLPELRRLEESGELSRMLSSG